MSSPKKNKSGVIGLMLAVLIFTAGWAYQINELPGEWYGDISIENNFVQAILAGSWPTSFVLSAGPTYHYLIAPVIAVTGPTFLGYKLASYIVAVIGLVGIYFYSRYLLTEAQAVMATALLSFAFPYFLFARLGSSPQMLTPVLAIWGVYFLHQFLALQKPLHFLISVVIALLGLYTYPSLYLLPVINIIVGIIVLVRRQKQNKPVRYPLFTLAGFLVVLALAVLQIFFSGRDNFTSGYIGSKLFAGHNTAENIVTFIRYFLKTLLSYGVTGDGSFRTNTSGLPQVPFAMGLLGVLGFWETLKRKHDRKNNWILHLSLILIIPAVSPGIPPAEIPSNSRTLAVLPFIIIFIVYGYRLISGFGKKRIFSGIFALIIIGYQLINTLYHYFSVYRDGLPNHNSAYGQIIADYLDKLPSEYKVIIGDCCWGDWGQPEPDGIYYRLKNRNNRENLKYVNQQVSCESISEGQTTIVIMHPKNQALLEKLSSCSTPGNNSDHLDKYGLPVFRSVIVK
jgi:hypothetical protein